MIGCETFFFSFYFSFWVLGVGILKTVVFIGIFIPLIWMPLFFILMYKKLYSNDTKPSCDREVPVLT